MKNLFTLKKVIAIFVIIFTFISCSDDDKIPQLTSEPEFYGSATNYYGKDPDSTVVRNDAVGKWFDEQNNELVHIQTGYNNPTFPVIIVNGIPVHQSFYAYNLTSKVDGYPISSPLKIDEINLYKNNINVGGMFHLVVEGNNGWLWVMRNTPYRVRVKKG